MQSQEVLEAAGKQCGIASVCVYGGVSEIHTTFMHQECLYCLLDAQSQVSKWGQKEALAKGVEVVVGLAASLEAVDTGGDPDFGTGHCTRPSWRAHSTPFQTLSQEMQAETLRLQIYRALFRCT